MPNFRPSLLRYAAASNASKTREAAREALHAKVAPLALPMIPKCPSPTCECAETPADLDIDTSIDLNGTMAPYSEHLVVSSGQADWKSKIEDEKSTASWGELVANVKQALSQKGSFHDPYHNVVVSTSSFSNPVQNSAASSQRTNPQALLFPSFRIIEDIDPDEKDIPDFIRTFLLPETLHPAYAQLAEEERQGKRRDISNLKSNKWTGKIRPISSPTILICSHNSRDSRCGILGPLLHAEFTQYINKRHTLRNTPAEDMMEERNTPSRTFASHPEFKPDAVDRSDNLISPVNIGMISHIGGHKFAGNVIIYIPPDYHAQPLERISRGAKPKDHNPEGPPTPSPASSSSPPTLEKKNVYDGDALDSYTDGLSPLAGKGIWYGRVEPKHVEGIVEQTIGHGKIIKELFRGGVNSDGSTIRLPLY